MSNEVTATRIGAVPGARDTLVDSVESLWSDAMREVAIAGTEYPYDLDNS